MSIQAIFTAEGGTLQEIEEAKKVLNLNESYDVEDALIESWNTDLVLVKHPEHAFNVSMFNVDFDALMRKYFCGGLK